MQRKRVAKIADTGEKIRKIYWECRGCGWQVIMYQSPGWYEMDPENEIDFWKKVQEAHLKYCPQCGEDRKENETKCGECGFNFEEDEYRKIFF